MRDRARRQLLRGVLHYPIRQRIFEQRGLATHGDQLNQVTFRAGRPDGPVRDRGGELGSDRVGLVERGRAARSSMSCTAQNR
jgi:hypothetical protein